MTCEYRGSWRQAPPRNFWFLFRMAASGPPLSTLPVRLAQTHTCRHRPTQYLLVPAELTALGVGLGGRHACAQSSAALGAEWPEDDLGSSSSVPAHRALGTAQTWASATVRDRRLSETFLSGTGTWNSRGPVLLSSCLYLHISPSTQLDTAFHSHFLSSYLDHPQRPTGD